RIVGRTLDQDGKEGFVLTLQAREQHIRRSKATSNICTNQGLVVTASTIYMSLLGPQGLEKVAAACHLNTNRLIEKVSAVKGVDVLFNGIVFHEVVLKLNKPVAEVLAALAEKNILGGFDLSSDYPQLENAMLVCATEMRTDEEIDRYARALSEIL
ncbi:MAG: glycine dehydrogenase, partial [Gammaproteobacteria bacterium]|nr:glycine dehydrogenase [Gammaproteobacteria bacterium]